MSLYYCLVPKMANAVVLWVIVYFCVTSVNTKDCYISIKTSKIMSNTTSRKCV